MLLKQRSNTRGGSFKPNDGATKASTQKKGLLAIALAMLLAVSLCIPTQAAYAGPLEDTGNAIASFFGLGDTRAAGDSEKFADASTANAHDGLLGDESSTQYAGRVWTDKTVFSGNATFEGDTGSPTVVNDSDFLVSYSALSTSTNVMGQTQAPIDVVFVIDLSGSMSNGDSNMDNGRSRIANTVDAVNASIDKLMELNEYTRVAVVGYSSTATTLLPLDHYSKRNNNSYLSLNRTEGSDRQSTTLTYQAVGSSGN